MTATEKRHFARFAIEATVRMHCGSRVGNAQLLDISLKGALISRPVDWQGDAGDHCRLEVVLPESDVIISMEGSVAHTRDEVLGFRCDQIDLASISHLRRLVELNLGDELQLERELIELLAQRS